MLSLSICHALTLLILLQVREEGSVETMEVLVEVLSSWGHPSRVGLTEIQFFDMKKRRIFVNHSQVKVQGATNVKGELEALFNGKCKVGKYLGYIS